MFPPCSTANEVLYAAVSLDKVTLSFVSKVHTRNFNGDCSALKMAYKPEDVKALLSGKTDFRDNCKEEGDTEREKTDGRKRSIQNAAGILRTCSVFIC